VLLPSTHRSLAWGVLGLAIGGLLFSLLTLLFSGVVPRLNPSTSEKFRSLVQKYSAVPSAFV
jgi:cell division protein FtsX